LQNNYELVIVLAPDLKDDQIAGLKGQIVDEMAGLGAEIVNEENWGKRDLAFEVKNYYQGFYHLYQFTAPPDMPGKLKGLLKVNEKVIRYIINKAEPKPVTAKDEKPEAEAPVVAEPKIKQPDIKPAKPVGETETMQPDAEPVKPVVETEKAEEDTEKTE
jgi:small subunit ribosomal protein S6